MSNTDRFKTHKRDQHSSEFRYVKRGSEIGRAHEQNILCMQDAEQTIQIGTCRLRSFLRIVCSRQTGDGFPPANPDYGAYLTASGVDRMGRSDKGGHESEAGMD